MFTKAIVRTPCKNMIHGLTTANLGKPDYKKALIQHKAYINALIKCGLEVIILDADERFPDSTFIEDTALLTKKCAIMMRPGEKSREGETISIKSLLRTYYKSIEEITLPGTIEGGDIMMVGSYFYIGLSDRTNKEGAQQLISILENYGLSGITVEITEMLHLKTGMAYLEDNTLVIAKDLISQPEFKKFNQIIIDTDESYAANCIWVNDKVLVPADFPKTESSTKKTGLNVITVDVSEFRKLDGGLSCLSLRF